MSYEEVECGMPVFRQAYDEASDTYSIVVRSCGEKLFVNTEEALTFYADGEAGGNCGPTWKVECYNGHVLLAPDYESNDDMGAIPFDGPKALEAMRSWVVIQLPPQGWDATLAPEETP